MRHKRKVIFISILFLLSVGFISFTINRKSIDDQILTYIVDAKSQDLQFYWKNNSGENLKSIQNLKSFVESKQLKLLFAMNGGMYKKDNSPQGLFIENKKTLSFIDTSDGEGNFYLKPNGVFYITSDNNPFVCKTGDFIDNGKINNYKSEIVFGPTCDSFDTIGEQLLPNDIKVGDWIFLPNMGAYTNAGMVEFNGIRGASN